MSLVAGSTFPITGHFELEKYLEHRIDSRGSSNRWLNAVGVVVNICYSVWRNQPMAIA